MGVWHTALTESLQWPLKRLSLANNFNLNMEFKMSQENQVAQTNEVVEKTAEQIAAEAAAAEAARKARIEAVASQFDNKVDVKEFSFGFRTVKDKETKVETKRPTVVLPLPVPSMEGIIAILEAGGKPLELMVEAIHDVVASQAREYVNENLNVTPENFPYDKFTFEYIANLPKADRRGGGIPAELWTAFADDYIEIMPALTNKTKEQVEVAAKVFVSKFVNAKTNKPVLKVLQQQLAIYVSATKKGEELEPVISWLVNKVEALVNTDETSLLLAL